MSLESVGRSGAAAGCDASAAFLAGALAGGVVADFSAGALVAAFLVAFLAAGAFLPAGAFLAGAFLAGAFAADPVAGALAAGEAAADFPAGALAGAAVEGAVVFGAAFFGAFLAAGLDGGACVTEVAPVAVPGARSALAAGDGVVEGRDGASAGADRDWELSTPRRALTAPTTATSNPILRNHRRIT